MNWQGSRVLASIKPFLGFMMSGSAFRPFTVMLLDDHELVRFGTNMWLARETDIDVIGSFATSSELFSALKARRADVIVTDFILAPLEIDGITLIRSIKAHHAECKLLVLSSQYTAATIALTLQAGADGFFGKAQDPVGFSEAVRYVARGRTYVPPAMVEAVTQLLQVPSVGELKSGLEGNGVLSPKEREVLRCFLDGLSVNEIAAKFSRSANTISTQKQSAYRKLGIKSDWEFLKLPAGLQPFNLTEP